MKYYAQFYNLSNGYIEGSIPPRFAEPQIIKALGDRAVIQLDGRMSHYNLHSVATDICKKRGYLAYHLMCGTCLRDAVKIGIRVDVSKRTELECIA